MTEQTLGPQQVILLRILMGAAAANEWWSGERLLCELHGFDRDLHRPFTPSERASVSRSLRRLQDGGYVRRHPEHRGYWTLTEAGYNAQREHPEFETVWLVPPAHLKRNPFRPFTPIFG